MKIALKTSKKGLQVAVLLLRICISSVKIFVCRLAANPPVTNNNTQLSQWLCEMHNQVNKKLGKAMFDCSLIEQRWRSGWKDGSCE